MSRPAAAAASSSASLWLAPLLVFALALLTTGALTAYVARSIAQHDRTVFESDAALTADAVRERVHTIVTLLRGTSGLYAASEQVDPGAFVAYVDRLRLREQYPGILGIGYSRRVDPAEAGAVVEQMRRNGLSDFRIWPDGPRDEVHTIVHLEPLDERNRAAMGYDMYTEPTRRAAMSAARDSGEPHASGRVTLKQEIAPEKQAGFLIYVPVYAGRDVPSDVDARRAALRGFVYSPLRVGDLLAGVAGSGENAVDLAVYDGDGADDGALLFSTRRAGSAARDYSLEYRLDVMGRPWLLRFAPTAGLDSLSQLLPWLIAVPVGTSLLLAGIAYVQARARRDAEAAAHERHERERRKDEFLAVLAHELRNPLAPIRSSLEVMRRAPGSALAERALGVAERQVRHMVRLVDDLLDVSRISRGAIELQRQTLPLVQVLDSAIEASRPVIEARGHRLDVVPVDPRLRIDGDPSRLAQVFANLLHNAANYTDAGGQITLRAEPGDDGRWVHVSVRDTGIGIDPARLPHLFEMFVQGGSAQASTGGLGIGLSLVKRLTQMHGGEVIARSEGRGRGSEFVVRLPLAHSEPDELTPQPEPPADTAARRVLVVDDNRDAAHSLAEMLRLDGHAVEVVHDGRAALAVAERGWPEVVLLDIGMPGMDGYEVARRLRASARGAALRLIAVSGWGQDADRRRAYEAGFDVHLVKPVDHAALTSQLAA